MRNIFLLWLISFPCYAFCQEDSVEIKYAPTLTEIGKPAGEKVSEKIDRDGGKLSSSDGGVELIIPPDAVSKKTNISIQAVVNTLSPGKANAYQLEPSGISFQKPLRIIFHYSAKEDAGMPELRNIAWQDDKGQWYSLDSCVVDTLARTVTGSIIHFSTWVFFDYFNLTPATARVKVGKKLRLEVICTYPGGLSDNFKTEMFQKIKFSRYVNGIPGGNAVVGTASSVLGSNDHRFLDYTAPGTVPDDNPVALSVEASNITFNRKTYSKLKLISNIIIFDKSYEITVIGYNKQRTGTCTLSGVDSSTCILQLNGSRSKIVDIQNMNYKLTISGCPCKVSEVNAGSSIGPINIVGATKIDVVPANPPQKPYAFITIYFIRNMGVIPAMVGDPCGHNANSSPAMAFPAVPLVLVFEAKDEEYTVAKEGTDNGFEIKVKPVKEDQ
jgi:hypothetical protein